MTLREVKFNTGKTMKVVHELKTESPWFNAVWREEKPFELRKRDRDFRVGDILKLREYDKDNGYSGRVVWADILSILDNVPGYGLVAGHCIIGIRPFLIQSAQNGSNVVGADRHIAERFNKLIQAINESGNQDLVIKACEILGVRDLP